VGRLRKLTSELRTFAADLAAAIALERQKANTITWPSPKWRHDPVGFARDVLGIRCWSRQAELVEAPLTHNRVTCRAGRRVSKSNSLAVLALWKFCSFERGDVLLTSATKAQLDGVLWSEVRRLHANSGLCADCAAADPNQARPCPHSAIIDGVAGLTSQSGLKGSDARYGRRIFGKTARKLEGLLGFGSPECLIIGDECSGVEDAVFGALTGMLAGGGAIVLCGNPTKTSGYFARTFKLVSWHAIHIASTESPNYIAGHVVIAGLATREWVDAEIEEHGEDSAHVAVHIKGEFAAAHQLRPFGSDVFARATAANHRIEPKGLLHISLDPALSGARDGRNDDSVFAVRRGKRILELDVCQGLDEHELLDRFLDLLERHALPGEQPVLNIDRLGVAGKLVGDVFETYRFAHPARFTLWFIRESDNPKRQGAIYNKHRDELYGNLADYLRDGGGLPEDAALEEELDVMEFMPNTKGRSVLTPKTQIRKLLGRSPDRADATALVCWQAPHTAWEDGPRKRDARAAPPATAAAHVPLHRPPPGRYDKGGAFDPFGTMRRR